MSHFSIVRRNGSGDIVERIRAIESVEIHNTMRVPGVPPLKNRVVLRAGLEYDEAFLLVKGDSDQFLNDGRWAQAGNNPGTFFEIEIGENSTAGWLLLDRYKLAAGPEGPNGPVVSLCHFVCQRYMLQSSPPAQALRLLVSGVSVASAEVSTAPIISALSGDKTVGMVQTILSQVWWYFGSVFGSSAENAGDIVYTGLPAPLPPIAQYSPGRTFAGLLQFYLDHWPALLRRRYQINSNPLTSNSHYSLEAISYTSGTKDTQKAICTWNNGIAKFNRPGAVFGQDGHRTFEFEHSMGNAGATLGGRSISIAMNPLTTTGNMGAPTVIQQAVRFCENRNTEGIVVPGYTWVAPDGYYNEIEYSDHMTTKIRRPIKRIQDDPHFREWDICVGKVTSGPTGLDQIIGGFWATVSVRINPFAPSRFPTSASNPMFPDVHDLDAPGSFEVVARNVSLAPITHGDYVVVLRSMRPTIDGAAYWVMPVKYDWEVVDGRVLEPISSGSAGDIEIALVGRGNYGSPVTTHSITATNLSGIDAGVNDRCIVLKRRHLSTISTIAYGFFVALCCEDPATPPDPDPPPPDPDPPYPPDPPEDDPPPPEPDPDPETSDPEPSDSDPDPSDSDPPDPSDPPPP